MDSKKDLEPLDALRMGFAKNGMERNLFLSGG